MSVQIPDSITIYHESSHISSTGQDVKCYGYTELLKGKVVASHHWPKWPKVPCEGCDKPVFEGYGMCEDCWYGPPFYLGCSHTTTSEDQC